MTDNTLKEIKIKNGSYRYMDDLSNRNCLDFI